MEVVDCALGLFAITFIRYCKTANVTFCLGPSTCLARVCRHCISALPQCSGTSLHVISLFSRGPLWSCGALLPCMGWWPIMWSCIIATMLSYCFVSTLMWQGGKPTAGPPTLESSLTHLSSYHIITMLWYIALHGSMQLAF